MSLKKWNVKHLSSDDVNRIAKTFSIPEITAKLLVSRGLTDDSSISEFINNQYEFSDPFLLADMDKAVSRINKAIDNFEKIAVYGDYDCDGITATAILYTYFSSAGADVEYYIPERNEGYGLNKNAIDSLSKMGVNLIVTVDNGISALDECRYIAELGMDIVITDHHQLSEQLPEAVAVVNPYRPENNIVFKEFCGAGIALKLVAAMENDVFSAAEYFGELAAIGTIGDVMPLKHENRTLVKYGLEMLADTANIGIAALIEACGFKGKKISAEAVAFSLIPRINAAGRMGNAALALQLLISEDDDEAFEIANQLCRLNSDRQRNEAAIMADISDMINKKPQILYDDIIVLAGNGWHAGVIGVVSARIAEKYGKPNVILSVDGDTAVGSARSVGDFSLFNALKKAEKYYIKFGGHKSAAGMTLKASDIEVFRETINSHSDLETADAYEIDAVVKLSELTLENINALSLAAPFGAGNPKPLFCIENVKICGIYPMSENKHIRVKLADGSDEVYAVMFNCSDKAFVCSTGDFADVIVSAEINVYKNQTGVSIKICDARPVKFNQSAFFAARKTFYSLMKSDKIDKKMESRIIPSREQTAYIYKYILAVQNIDNDIEKTFLKLYKSGINYCKMRCIFQLLYEVGLIKTNGDFSHIEPVLSKTKIDLDNSEFMRFLKCRF